MLFIEILALIFAIIVLVKILLLLIDPRGLVKLGRALLKARALIFIIQLVLVIILGYYLLDYFTIVEMAALALLASLLIGMNLVSYSRSLTKLLEEATGKGMCRRHWLIVVIWVALAIWVLYAVLG